MIGPWKLSMTQQCANCPWYVKAKLHTIPNYSHDLHEELHTTIANANHPMGTLTLPTLHIMACHKDHQAHCIGWLHNQITRGNNIALRLRMLSCTNARLITLRGEQYGTLQDTLDRPPHG